ncbi:innexin inx2-like [Tropilaelaps mercedesae]|uniref:Innexin n=1 Tax=Tropilaelaps mercedesae TaxID=418985 RepID=A0A1V9XCM4_9ACAR|nr:innexin inx2-like [Tropilaelaps mercedesae]
MMELLKAVKNWLNLSKDKTYIDSYIFRMHYRLTTILLLGCSALVTSHQYFGDPIDCLGNIQVKAEVLDRYCWIQKTFSLPVSWTADVGTRLSYPGVEADEIGSPKNRVYHAYYQWVCFVLFFQAVLFYVPHYVWKALEGGRMRKLIRKIPDPFDGESAFTDGVARVVCHMRAYRRTSFRYGVSYLSCEMLNLVNVIGQTYLMDRFLGGEFFTYGLQVIAFTEWSQEVRYDPMIKRFPRVTKCTFRNFGPSGDIQQTDHMCLLSVNIINEKIYLFLWFWFFGLAAVTAVAALYRIAIVIDFQHTRSFTLMTHHCIDPKNFRTLCHRLPYGEFLLLALLLNNIDRLAYDHFVEKAVKFYDNDVSVLASSNDTKGWYNECKIDFADNRPPNHRNPSSVPKHYSTTAI